ncbi:MAG: GYF domain-containing protein [Myxococcaceae bacterium]
MNFSCEKCHRKYTIPDERAAGRLLRVRCKVCGHIMQIQGPPEDEEPEALTRSVTHAELMRLVKEPAPAPHQDPEPDDENWESETTRAQAGPDPDVQWFAMVRGAQIGPFAVARLVDRIRQGEVTLRTYVWRAGRADWARAEDVPELVPLFGPPPSAPTPVMVQRVPPTDEATDPGTQLQGPEQRKDTGERIQALFTDVEFQQEETQRFDENPLKAAREAIPQETVPNARRSSAAFDDETRIPKKRRGPSVAVRVAIVVALLSLVLGVVYSLTRPGDAPPPPAEKPQVAPAAPAAAPSESPAPEADTKRPPEAGLRDKLLGEEGPPPSPEETPSGVRGTDSRGVESSKPSIRAEAKTEPRVSPKKPAAGPPQKRVGSNLEGLVGRKGDVGPSVREEAPDEDDEAVSTRSPEELAAVVETARGSFENCIAQYVKTHAAFRGGKVRIIATIGPSGTVKRTSVDNPEVDRTELGDCLKSRAKRLVFPEAPLDDDLDLEIPLVLTTTF